ncbi:DUF4430 domain-containing protein [Candidatus Parcubacteria bacterium]|jgi:hypothetical protein|nr:MAG: DUF4430 domain-containing protein [Candidatus Parcubacteria bacterium]
MNYINSIKPFGLLVVLVVALVACTPISNQNQNLNQNANTNTANANVSQQNTNAVPSVSYVGEAGKTALELLKSKFQGVTTKTSGQGEYVTGINGREAGEKEYWGFYVNGKSAPVGAGQYQTKTDDQIEWKLITF